jgi:hypothetical protein
MVNEEGIPLTHVLERDVQFSSGWLRALETDIRQQWPIPSGPFSGQIPHVPDKTLISTVPTRPSKPGQSENLVDFS